MKEELKTLKDLPSYKEKVELESFMADKDQFVRGSEIKAEAVKRAKLYTIKANTNGLKDYEIKYWTARRIEVMEFNNLTEEDLK